MKRVIKSSESIESARMNPQLKTNQAIEFTTKSLDACIEKLSYCNGCDKLIHSLQLVIDEASELIQ